MNKPCVLSQSIEGNQVTLELRILPSIRFFEGHFPDHPVLPGVAQIYWAESFARHYFSDLGEFTRLENIKFHSIIVPNTQIFLLLNYQPEKRKITFTYSTNEKKYSSGRLLLDR